MITFVCKDGSEFQLPSGPEFGPALLTLMKEVGFTNTPRFAEKLDAEYDKAFGLGKRLTETETRR